MIAPIFKQLSDELGNRANFIKVDVDDNPEAAQKYGVSAMPTFLFIKGGEEVDRLMGANAGRLKEVSSSSFTLVIERQMPLTLTLFWYYMLGMKLIEELSF